MSPRFRYWPCSALTGLLVWSQLFAVAMGEDLASLTRSHTRVVWVQDLSPDNADTILLGRNLRLMALDSQDGRGERPVLNELRNYSKPLLTPDGQQIVFSDRQRRESWVVNWDGTDLRRLAKGFAVEVWKDPGTGVTWVYVATQVGRSDGFNFRSLRRLRLDGEGSEEVVWDRTEISPDNFQLSRSGLMAAGEFPWPHGGTLDLERQSVRKRADGCWASLAPDDSGLCWVFDGPHRNLYLYPPKSQDSWGVPLNTAPGTASFEVFHPRWSNHPRFLCMTGPYKVASPVNQIAGGGPEVEVFVGRFREDFRDVEAWSQVTSNQRGDFHPDVWIQNGEEYSIPESVLTVTDAMNPAISTPEWPLVKAGLLFAWENNRAQNTLPETSTLPGVRCRVEPYGQAVFGRFFEMQCTGGFFLSDPLDGVRREAFQKSHAWTLEATITASKARVPGTASIVSTTTESASGDSLDSDSVRSLLVQNRDQLVVTIPGPDRTASQTIALATVVPNEPQHLVLTSGPEELVCYLNGREVQRVPVSGGLADLSEFPVLLFGDRRKTGPGWPGSLEAVAVYPRVVEFGEIQQLAALRQGILRQRTVPDRCVVRAICVQSSTIPDPRTIVPYRRALVVHHYRIERQVSGRLDVPEILVAEWGILDKTVQPRANRRAGETVQLTIEDFQLHPELTSERRIEEVDALELPLYYSIPE